MQSCKKNREAFVTEIRIFFFQFISSACCLSSAKEYVIVHHKDAKDSKTRKELSLKDTTFANLGVLCAFAVHKRLYGERLQEYCFGILILDAEMHKSNFKRAS